jgi:hypothetical protein
MTMCERLPLNDCGQMELPLILSAAGSLARTSAPPARVPGLMASAAAYGRNTPELLASFDPATSSWRTSQLSLEGGLTTFSETWPRSGLMRNGIAFQLPPLVRLTDATESELLPTPAATPYGTNHGGGMGRVGPVRPSLETMARRNLWPTPTSTLGTNGGRITPRKSREGVTLIEAISARFWPPPHGMCVPTTSWAEAVNQSIWPTPTADRRSGLQSHGQNAILGSLNPTWVEWLMGFPLGWTDCGPSATPSSRRSPKSSAAPSCK